MPNQPDKSTLSDDEMARDDPDLCEHGWSRLHPQPCPECEDASPAAETTIDRTSVIVRLTLLIGACRMPRITKRQIEQSLQAYIDELEKAA